jgi:hypothetical protein
MGASSITQHLNNAIDLSEAWENVYTEARHAYGNDSYSGSFATCSGVVQIADMMSLGEAVEVADAFFQEEIVPKRVRTKLRSNVVDGEGKVTRAPQKWGAAYAIPVYRTDDIRSKSRELTVTHEIAGYLGTADLARLVETKIELKPNSWLAKLDVVEDKVRSRRILNRAVGKFTTTWVLVGARGERLEVGKEYATEREAIAAAEASLRRTLELGRVSKHDTISVEAIRRRDGKSTSVGIELLGRKTRISFEIQTAGSTQHGGWFFFGWAAS